MYIYTIYSTCRCLDRQREKKERLRREQQAQAAANLNGLEIVEPPFEMKKSNRSPEFLAKFPLGKVPAFETTDGKVRLFESDAIAQFIAESGPASAQLLGADSAERARIRQWIIYGEGELMNAVVLLVLWRLGLTVYDEHREKTALASLERALEVLETHLAAREKEGKQWLITDEKLSLADISVASAFMCGCCHVIDAEMRARFPLSMAWFERTRSSEGVKQAFGEREFKEKRQAPPA